VVVGHLARVARSTRDQPEIAKAVRMPASGCSLFSGFAAYLIAAVEEECRTASIPTLWLYTNTAEHIYARADWRTVELVQRGGKPVVFVRRDLGKIL